MLLQGSALNQCTVPVSKDIQRQQGLLEVNFGGFWVKSKHGTDTCNRRPLSSGPPGDTHIHTVLKCTAYI